MKKLIGVSAIVILVVSAVLVFGQTPAPTEAGGPFTVGGCAQIYALPVTLSASNTWAARPPVYKTEWVRIRTVSGQWVELTFEDANTWWVNVAAIAWVRPISDAQAAGIKGCGPK